MRTQEQKVWIEKGKKEQRKEDIEKFKQIIERIENSEGLRYVFEDKAILDICDYFKKELNIFFPENEKR